MLTKKQATILIREMFEKQDQLNIHTNGKDWKLNKDLKWFRAIWTECAELIDYTNWKWWRKQDVSVDDIKIEVVDIYHFMMSNMLVKNDIEDCVRNVYEQFNIDLNEEQDINMTKIQTAVEDLAYFSLKSTSASIYSLATFVEICRLTKLDITNLYKLYMGKNILNKFRQDNGYKQKTYQKIWNGKEDNIYLMKILNNIDIEKPKFETNVYNQLQKEYNMIVG